MATDLLPARIAHRVEPKPVRVTPDRAVIALPTLIQFRDSLRLAVRFAEACARLAQRAEPCGEPPLFFFRPELQAEWERVRVSGVPNSAPLTAIVSRRDPEAARAWELFPKLCDGIESELWHSVELRRTARAIPDLHSLLTRLAPTHPRAARLAELLAIPDDEVVLVIHPEWQTGWRFHVQGIADVAQFHVLMIDAIGEFAPGLAAAVDVYRGMGSPNSEAPEVTGRFQFFAPHSLRADGTLPAGLSGNRGWIWGTQSLARVPRIDGERVLLIGEPTIPPVWDAMPRFPTIPAKLRTVESLASDSVNAWIRDWCGVSTTHADLKTVSGSKPAPRTVFGSTPSQSRSTAA